MTENTFPVYRVDAIVSFYRSEVLTAQEAKLFSKSDLVPSPKPESVQKLYMRVLQLLNPSRPECHFMVPLMDNIQNPVFHEVTTSVMRVYLRMCQFLPMCRVHDFSLNDLLEPKTKKTMVVLSGIMNFIHFKKLRMELSLEHLDRFRVDMERFQTCSRGIKEAEKKRNILTTIPPEKQAEAQVLSSALAEVESKIIHEYQQAKVLNETVAKWKTDVAEWTQKVAQGKVDVSTQKEIIEKLTSQIVESPEELKSQMEKLRESTRLNKTAIGNADVKLMESQNSLQRVSQVEGELQLMFGLLQDLQGGLNSTKQQDEELQELTLQYERQQKELKSMRTEEGQMKRAHAIKLDKESKSLIRREKTKQSMEQKVQGITGQCRQVYQKREGMAKQIEEVSREAQQMKVKMQSLKDMRSHSMKKAQAMYDVMLASLDEKHKRMERALLELSVDMDTF